MFFTWFSEWSWQSVLVRILTSLILGAVIGIDRGVKKRGGGARTTLTVCLGATMVMLIEQYMQQLYAGEFDVTRLAAQVISGVGFLGAGSILVSGHQIKGLTSAASIWTCACVGLAVGIGFVDGAVILTFFWLFGLHIVPVIEDAVYKRSRYMTLYIEVEDGKAITAISRKLKQDNCHIDTFGVDKPKAKGQHYQIMATFTVPKSTNKENYMHELHELKGVYSVTEI